MGDPLQSLSDADLRTLSAALIDGRLEPPYTAAWVGRLIDPATAVAVAARLTALAGAGMQPGHVAVVADAILTARAGRPVAEDVVELVWTGPEVSGMANRDTGVVTRELFAQASESILVAGFAVFQGRSLFRPLAQRMAERPSLRARLYLNVHRGHLATSSDAEIVTQFAHNFIANDWPQGFRFPEVYYDPRSLAADAAARASLHAKCVVVDRRMALVTSANFTEAAQERNIEAGVVVRSERFASRLADHFDTLANSRTLRRVALPDA